MYNIISKLKSKPFRDAYVSAHLTQGLAFQIKALRTQRGWSQKELATRLGLNGQSAVARMEDPSYGKLSIATLLKLSSIFDVALSVRFNSFGKFINDREDLSTSALSVESFDCELPKLIEKIEEDEHTSVGRFFFSDQFKDFEYSDSKPMLEIHEKLEQNYIFRLDLPWQ